MAICNKKPYEQVHRANIVNHNFYKIYDDITDIVSFIRTIPLVLELHQINQADFCKVRGLYRQWRISLRPETDIVINVF